jgi:hypothetical protein
VRLIKIKGLYTDLGKIVLENKKTIDWDDLTVDKPVFLPFGSNVELIISFDENDFLSGKDGIVWATYDSRQAEVVQNTLLAQNINCEIKKIEMEKIDMFLIAITNERDTKVAIDFIWEGNNGLRLNPDWSYPQGETNKSFEQWLNGH